MDRRDLYLFKAAELLELAKTARYAALQIQFENMAIAYLRLADQAQLNDGGDLAQDELPLTRVLGDDLQK